MNRAEQYGLKLRLALSALLAVPASHAIGETYPDKPVRLIIASAPGGGSDLLGRIVAQGLAEAWQRPAVVDNRVGVGGAVATELAAKAAPDGYTLLVQSFSIAYLGELRRNLPFDVTRDIAPIVLIGGQPSLLAVHSAVPVNSVAELIQLAKMKPRQLNYGTSGAGGASHLGTELFSSVAQIQLVPVNYKGTGFAMTALVSGEVHLALVGLSTALAHAKAKRIKALGVSSTSRSALVPDVPTIAETLPGFEFDVWYGIFGPPKIPRDILLKINTTVNQVLKQPAVRERIAAAGVDPRGGTEAQFVKFFRSEVAKWKKVIRDAGIRSD